MYKRDVRASVFLFRQRVLLFSCYIYRAVTLFPRTPPSKQGRDELVQQGAAVKAETGKHAGPDLETCFLSFFILKDNTYPSCRVIVRTTDDACSVLRMCSYGPGSEEMTPVFLILPGWTLSCYPTSFTQTHKHTHTRTHTPKSPDPTGWTN